MRKIVLGLIIIFWFLVSCSDHQGYILCNECDQLSFVMEIGSCKFCGDVASISAFESCIDCARQKSKCQAGGNILVKMSPANPFLRGGGKSK